MSAIMIPAHPASGTPRVMRKDWNGLTKFSAKKTTHTVPMLRITPSTSAAAGRGMRTPSESRVRPEE